MTASEADGGSAHTEGGATGRSVADVALDLLVYAPAGALLTAASDMPAMAVKGRQRIEQEVRNAHVVGRFVVDAGMRQVRGQLERLIGERAGHEPAPAPQASPATRGAAPRAPAGTPGPGAGGASRTGPAPRPAPRGPSGIPGGSGPATRDPAVDRAIPDYDTLSASQVVRRLDGLKPRELRAVVRHELANRGRRTVLHRAEQLLGQVPPASSPASP